MHSDKLNAATSIVGVIGHPIRHSLSPIMHNVAFELLKLNYVYLSFDVPASNLKSALKGAVALGIKGLNVTLPLKEKIIQYLNNVSEEASIVGAVNTVVNENGSLHGFNTDVYGILETLLPYRGDLHNSVVSVVGAGGACRSVIFTLIRYFKIKRINLINRTEQKAESLKEYFSTRMHYKSIKTYALVPPDLTVILKNSQCIINASSIGMSPNSDDSFTDILDSFQPRQIVFDVVYTPLQTHLLKIARSEGAVTIDGLKMFVLQGAKSFELWTGTKMPADKIYKSLRLYLQT